MVEIFGSRVEIINHMEKGGIRAMFYPGGHFLAGFKHNAMKAAEELGMVTFEPAVAKAIRIDPVARRHAVTVETADGKLKRIIADNLLMAFSGWTSVLPFTHLIDCGEVGTKATAKGVLPFCAETVLRG
jgi:glycine/D-amino acid oxidase-like deaminating enzyme